MSPSRLAGIGLLMLAAAVATPAPAMAKTCDLDEMLRQQGGTSSIEYILVACQKGDDVRIPLMLIHTIEQVCDFDKRVAIDASDHVSCFLGGQESRRHGASRLSEESQVSR